MRSPDQVLGIVEGLEKEYPLADCTLEYRKDYELLFSVRLAAQCTDERVNLITPALFERFPTLESFAAAAHTLLRLFPSQGARHSSLRTGAP